MEIPRPPQHLRSRAVGEARWLSVWIIRVTPSLGLRAHTAAGNAVMWAMCGGSVSEGLPGNSRREEDLLGTASGQERF